MALGDVQRHVLDGLEADAVGQRERLADGLKLNQGLG
jgi:hypothetical protein